MKKDKQDKPARSEKKQARKNVQQQLMTELKAITGQLGQKAEDVAIDIEKESKKLAKKITRGLKAILPHPEGQEKEKPVENKPAVTKPEIKASNGKATAKPATAAAKKPVAEAAPAKPASTKTAAVKSKTTA